jgi:transposase InsO family protein
MVADQTGRSPDRQWLVEHRYRAVQEVLAGQPVAEVAQRYGMSRQTLYGWKHRYDAGGLLGLQELSRRPLTSPSRLDATVEAQICEMRRTHPRWGARRICFELRQQSGAAPSRATVHRTLVRNGFVDPHAQRHKRRYRRWEREEPMELWQLDIVDGMLLGNGRRSKIVTGIDDHSRYAVIAAVVARPTGRAVCAAFTAAMHRYGVPQEVLSDNGKQFTGRFTKPRPVQVLFERICSTNGIVQRLTKTHSPTTTGKVERFHLSLQVEFLDESGPFADLATAQAALDSRVHTYNHDRPHQSLQMATPASRFQPHTRPRPDDELALSARMPAAPTPPTAELPSLEANDLEAVTAVEVHLVVPASGAVSLAGRQQLWVGRAFAGRTVTVWADERSVHVTHHGERVRSVPSRLSTIDLEHLTLRGGRPAGPAPAGPALGSSPLPADAVIEVERTADRYGCIAIGGQRISIGAPVAGQRLTLRLDGHLMHVVAAGHLVKTLPAPVSADQRAQLREARLAESPLPPPPPPPGTARARRRVPADGVVMVAGQRLRVGRVHAGKTVTIVVEDTYYRVLHEDEELSTHPRLTGKSPTHFKVPATRRPASTVSGMS